jgi:hypothetical protein
MCIDQQPYTHLHHCQWRSDHSQYNPKIAASGYWTVGSTCQQEHHPHVMVLVSESSQPILEDPAVERPFVLLPDILNRLTFI